VPHVIETATSGRAKCRACSRPIAKGELRFGERLPNPFAEGDMTHWFHPACAAFMRPEPFLEALSATTDPIADRDWLEAEARLGTTHRRLPRAHTVERASSGRAACRSCRQPIAKDSWRISLLYDEEGRFVPSGFIHLGCASTYFETTDLMRRLRHFSPGLTDAEADEIRAGLAQTG
jgi:Poly(ADP-ribose) polymerase and DNA-Ligase Zn-finger region